MRHVIGYGDTNGTFFLGKEPQGNTPKTFDWVPLLSKAHCFESEETAQSLIDNAMKDYENVYVLNVRMGAQ